MNQTEMRFNLIILLQRELYAVIEHCENYGKSDIITLFNVNRSNGIILALEATDTLPSGYLKNLTVALNELRLPELREHAEDLI